MVEISTNTICFEGICRVYRNAVVDHICVTLSAKYPDDWQERVRKPFKKEWETIRKNAESARNKGLVSEPLKDPEDLLGVNHFESLFRDHFDDLFPNLRDMPESDRKDLRGKVLSRAHEIKEVRDPSLGHPAEADMTPKEGADLLSDAEFILKHIDQDAAQKVRDWWHSVISSAAEVDLDPVQPAKVVEASTLPARETIVPRFIGRQTELEELSVWLKDPYSRVWLLAGDGGKGKTAIAYQFAVSVLDEPLMDLEAVIWLSAKARRFVQGQSVEIEVPDFTDLGSALDGVLRAYGSPDFESKDLPGKEQECREYLSALPVLIVLDDLDSLEGDSLTATMSYFLNRTPSAKSKILLTSRRIPLGMQHTQVKGFETASDEGIRFIDSRIEMYGLEAKQFPREIKNNILDACDGSPLFIQDLLRLCITGEPVRAAIARWRRDGGENARQYALEREFEMLSDVAKKVLLSCALYEGPASVTEIRAASDISATDSDHAIQELQDSFLVPRHQLIDGVPRFSLDVNTRQLVLDVLGKSDLAGRLRSAIQAITGQSQSTPAHRQRVGQYIRQAVSQSKLNNHGEAENTLWQALELFPENADLHGMLGWVYKSWKPHPRYTDARTHFSRAADLKCSNEETYRHWCDMEANQKEWSSATAVAERGLEVIGKSQRLSFLAGFTKSRLAQDLFQQAQYSRAEQELDKAESHLKSAFLELDDLKQGGYQFQSKVHRAMVINYEHRVRICQRQQDSRGESRFLRLMGRALDRWRNEHPDDSYASSERQRLLYWFPSLNDYLDG